MIPTAKTDRAMAMIEEAVRAGERCPTSRRGANSPFASSVVRELARLGKIRICVYPRNYRTVEILTGPLAGKRTKAPPDPRWKPYLVVDASTLKAQAVAGAQQPHTFRHLPARKIAP